ncbi:class I SAM-dependent methyltransferase [Phenylobacterium sp.]|jgi:SAM-dependent methyltransferase|uniref:class I SAM-dependent methyltransferase n=1 Tax=Phenylobacterium sp. TaxID=1871053 RepID=UPI002F957A91
MDFSDPVQRAVFFDLHSELPREGPGDRATVGRALGLIADLPGEPAVLDIACGPGGQTMDLAEFLPRARITALDMHPPFLRDLDRRAAGAGLSGRIRTMRGDMRRLSFKPESFDLFWCEGAAYIVGLPRALVAWKPLLKPGGYLVLSEPVWLKPKRPPDAAANWAEYPAMTDVEGVRIIARAEGYEVVGDFVLSEEAWWTNYYGPLEARIAELRPRYGSDEVASGVVDAAQFEIDCYRRHADAFGYLMLVLRPSRGP